MFNRFNEGLALRTVAAVATMQCVYIFLLLCVLPLFTPQWQNHILFISNSFQLVLLPLIMVGQGVAERRSRAQADQDHAAVLEILATIRADHALLQATTAELHALVTELHGVAAQTADQLDAITLEVAPDAQTRLEAAARLLRVTPVIPSAAPASTVPAASAAADVANLRPAHGHADKRASPRPDWAFGLSRRHRTPAAASGVNKVTARNSTGSTKGTRS